MNEERERGIVRRFGDEFVEVIGGAACGLCTLLDFVVDRTLKCDHVLVADRAGRVGGSEQLKYRSGFKEVRQFDVGVLQVDGERRVDDGEGWFGDKEPAIPASANLGDLAVLDQAGYFVQDAATNAEASQQLFLRADQRTDWPSGLDDISFDGGGDALGQL